MSATRRIVFGVGISWFVRAISILSGLFLLPVFMRVMNREELGTWMVFGNSQSFLGLLNFGVTPTLARHVALAKGRSGADPDVILTAETQQHIADLVSTGRTILRCLALFSFVVALSLGFVFLRSINFQQISLYRVLVSWTVLSLGYGVGVWISYLEFWTWGLGYVGRINVVMALITVATLGANIVAALLGGGILALSCIFVVAAWIQRLFMRLALAQAAPVATRVEGHWNRDYAKKLVRPSFHLWLYSLGYFLAMQSGSYFIMQRQGAAEVPSYQAAYSMLTNLQLLAGSFAITSSVFLSQAWEAGDRDAVRRHTIRFAQMGLSIMAVGVSFLLTVGHEFIELWLGPNSFVGYPVLAVMSLAYTIQIHSMVLTSCARATEDERYAISAVAAGVINVVLCWLLIGRWGVLGIALSLLIAEVVSNGWYCVVLPLRRLEIGALRYTRRVVLLGLTAFLSAFLLSDVLADRLRAAGASRLVIVSVAGSVSALVFGSVIWLGIFDGNHRRRVLERVFRWI